MCRYMYMYMYMSVTMYICECLALSLFVSLSLFLSLSPCICVLTYNTVAPIADLLTHRPSVSPQCIHFHRKGVHIVMIGLTSIFLHLPTCKY